MTSGARGWSYYDLTRPFALLYFQEKASYKIGYIQHTKKNKLTGSFIGQTFILHVMLFILKWSPPEKKCKIEVIVTSTQQHYNEQIYDIFNMFSSSIFLLHFYFIVLYFVYYLLLSQFPSQWRLFWWHKPFQSKEWRGSNLCAIWCWTSNNTSIKIKSGLEVVVIVDWDGI